MEDDLLETNITLPEAEPDKPLGPPGGANVILIHPPSLKSGQRFELKPRSAYRIGRRSASEICVPMDGVSRTHAKLSWSEDGWTIEDLGSTNGTFVDNAAVTAPQRLQDGSSIRIGKAILRFLLADNPEAQYHEALYDMSAKDALTGAYNKRYFLEVLDREISRSVRYKSGLCLVLLDIDHFKNVNDTHGHLAGDEILRCLGRRILGRLRKEDLFVRFGGEEFACILPNTPMDGARILAEALRKLVAANPFAVQNVQVPVTISLGLAYIDGTERPTCKEFVAKADVKLYEAKRGGRNRVAL